MGMKMSRKKKALLWILTFAVGFIIMWPVYWIIKSSFTQQVDLFKSPIEYRPIHLTLDNYRQLFQAAGLTEYLKGTVIITAVFNHHVFRFYQPDPLLTGGGCQN